MDKGLQQEEKFGKSLKELGELSSQLYHVADYCQTAFYKSQDKTSIVETTKDYISQAVVTLVDHLGTISALVEHTISVTNALPETECRIQSLKLRIGTCQQYSLKFALARFRWNAELSKHHHRYIMFSMQDQPALMSPASSRDCVSWTDAESEQRNQLQIAKPVQSDINKCKKAECPLPLPAAHLIEGYKDANLLHKHNGLSTLMKPKQHSNFQLKETRKKLKRNMIKLTKVQNKDIPGTLIRHGKWIFDPVGV